MHVIIVGNGLAGLALALKCSEKGHSVTVISKCDIDSSNSWYAQGGIAASSSEEDIISHIEDTIKAGANHNNRNIVTNICNMASACIQSLSNYNINFNDHLSKEGGHSTHRIHNMNDETGKRIITELFQQIKQKENITTHFNEFVYELMVDSKKCKGIRSFSKDPNGRIICNDRFADSVVLCTGGVGSIYGNHSSNPTESTADGMALAHKAGVDLLDLEFIQFHPTGLDSDNKKLLITEALRGDGATIVNSDLKRFMSSELTTRDILSRGIFQEQSKGIGKIYLDVRHLYRFEQRFPMIAKQCKHYDGLIPITPVQHFICGGIKTGMNGRTCIEGLYASGECACSGFHGANRLASNSLLECLAMAEHISKDIDTKSIYNKKTFDVTQYHDNFAIVEDADGVHKQLSELMWTNVGIIRTKEKLKTAKEDIQKLITNIESTECILEDDYHNVKKTMELRNMITIASLITQSAMNRTNNMGSHFIS